MNVEPLAPRAILIDVGDTLLEEKRFDLVAGIGAVVGDNGRATALADAFRAQMNALHLEHRELSLASWLRERVGALQARSVVAIEDAVWDAVVTLVPRPGVHRALSQIAADGVPLAAVSNAAFSGRVLRLELGRHGVAASLRFVLSSADLGIRKPAAAIFESAVARLQVPASSTWFVGDTWDEDILGARHVGLQALWFGGNEAVAGSVPVVRDWDSFRIRYAAARLRAPAG